MARIASGAALLVLAGCTFTGLADYDTPGCDPTLPYAQDPCATVDIGNTSCLRSQCDPATQRCSTRALDEDKDGDPSVACGGTDCDDHDPKRSGRTLETCDGIDNDCNGVTDDALLVAIDGASEQTLVEARGGGADLTMNGMDGRATYLGTQVDCVRDVVLGGASPDAGCTSVLLADAGVPSVRQPQLRTVGSATNSTVGIAFVSSDIDQACNRERLGYFSGNVNGNGGGVLGDCGASLPSLASFPSSPSALIAFYDTPLATRQDPIGGCATAAPAPLNVRYVDGAIGAAPDLYTSTAATLGDATATRPPVLLPIAGTATLLLASPIAATAGLWALTADGRVVPLAPSIDVLAGARSVAVALREGSASIAIVAEQGCPPQQSLTFALADFSPTQPVVGAFRATVLVPSATTATAPSVAWSAARGEWWVSWLDGQSQAILARVSADGAHVSAPLAVGAATAAVVLTAAPSADPRIFLSRPDRPAIEERVIACPRMK